jgi:hypothetical protein
MCRRGGGVGACGSKTTAWWPGRGRVRTGGNRGRRHRAGPPDPRSSCCRRRRRRLVATAQLLRSVGQVRSEVGAAMLASFLPSSVLASLALLLRLFFCYHTPTRPASPRDAPPGRPGHKISLTNDDDVGPIHHAHRTCSSTMQPNP